MRIVSLAPSNSEILYALGAGNQIVAVTSFCNYPKSVQGKPKIGGWTTASVKKVKEFHPDLVITSTFLQDKIVKKLKTSGLKVLHVDPKTLDDVFKSILTIGKAINKESAGKKLVAKLYQYVNTIKQKLKFIKNKPRVYIEEWHMPPMISGNWVPKIVELAAGKYLIKEGEISRKIAQDEITNFDPQLIILSLCGYGKRPSPNLIYGRPGWQNISAVRDKKVFVFDDDLLNRPGPRLVDGLKQLIKVLY